MFDPASISHFQNREEKKNMSCMIKNMRIYRTKKILTLHI